MLPFRQLVAGIPIDVPLFDVSPNEGTTATEGNCGITSYRLFFPKFYFPLEHVDMHSVLTSQPLLVLKS